MTELQHVLFLSNILHLNIRCLKKYSINYKIDKSIAIRFVNSCFSLKYFYHVCKWWAKVEFIFLVYNTKPALNLIFLKQNLPNYLRKYCYEFLFRYVFYLLYITKSKHLMIAKILCRIMSISSVVIVVNFWNLFHQGTHFWG